MECRYHELSRELCDLTDDIKLESDGTGIDITRHARVFKGGFVTESDISREELQGIDEIWISIKDNAGIIGMVFDGEIDNLDLIENVAEMEIDNEDNSEEEDEEEVLLVS